SAPGSTDSRNQPSSRGSSTISPSSVAAEGKELGDCVRAAGSMAAAFAAAAWMSRGARVAGRGREAASSGKLRIAAAPLMLSAATSWARAAISGVGNVPSQMRDFLRGSRISDTHFPQLRFRTPRYTRCLLWSAPPPLAAFFAGLDVPVAC
ncbi:hypothetical protein MUK42_24797, partial [Musa troglodytarum]